LAQTSPTLRNISLVFQAMKTHPGEEDPLTMTLSEGPSGQ